MGKVMLRVILFGLLSPLATISADQSADDVILSLRVGDIVTVDLSDGDRIRNAKVEMIISSSGRGPTTLILLENGKPRFVPVRRIERISTSKEPSIQTLDDSSPAQPSMRSKGREPTRGFTIVNNSDQTVQFYCQAFVTLDGRDICAGHEPQVILPGDRGFVAYKGDDVRPKQVRYLLQTKHASEQYELEGVGQPIVVSISNGMLPKPKPVTYKRSQPPQLSDKEQLDHQFAPRYSAPRLEKDEAFENILKALLADLGARFLRKERKNRVLNVVSGFGVVFLTGKRNGYVERAIRGYFGDELSSAEVRAAATFACQVWDSKFTPEGYAVETGANEIIANLEKSQPALARNAKVAKFLVELASEMDRRKDQ